MKKKLTLAFLIAGLNISFINAFNDINGHWAINEINDFKSKNIIAGYEDNTFRPNNNVTRAEFLRIMNNAFDIDIKNDSIDTDFSDIENHWAKEDIQRGVSNGIYDISINKKLNSMYKFRPDDFITREEASTMICNYLEIKDSEINRLEYFWDKEEVSYWAKTSLEKLIELDIITGYKDKTINPKGKLTRAELVTLINRLEKIQSEYTDDIPVLMYHHFDEKGNEGAVVSENAFIKQIEYLNDNRYNTITTQDLYKISINEKLMPKNPVLIVADDGYLSNYEFMYPRLKERNMKSTIFVIGQDIDNASKGIQPMWHDRFNWNQAKEMVDSGYVDIELHTYNSHNKIKNEKKEKGDFSMPKEGESLEAYKSRIDKDIKQNKKVIKENLGYTPIAFAYPFGEYSKISEKVLKENGVKMSFTVKDGFINLDEDFYLLNRITVSGKESFETFKKKLER